jgi:hypothetical protein
VRVSAVRLRARHPPPRIGAEARGAGIDLVEALVFGSAVGGLAMGFSGRGAPPGGFAMGCSGCGGPMSPGYSTQQPPPEYHQSS